MTNSIVTLAVAAALSLTSNVVSANEKEEVTFIVGSYVAHDTDGFIVDDYFTEWNEGTSNNTVGIEYKGYTLLTFENSYYNTTVVAGYNFEVASYSFNDTVSVKANVLVGAVFGYTEYQLGKSHIAGNVGLYVLPSVTASYKINNDITLNATTGIIGTSVSVSTFSITYSF